MNLKIEILRALDAVGKHAYEEPVLLFELQKILPTAPSAGEFEAAVTELRNRGYVRAVFPELGGHAKLRITEDGKGALESAL